MGFSCREQALGHTGFSSCSTTIEPVPYSPGATTSEGRVLVRLLLAVSQEADIVECIGMSTSY